MKVFELYDVIVGETISHHKTIEGAVLAMAHKVQDLAKVLESDYGNDTDLDFELQYKVISINVQD